MNISLRKVFNLLPLLLFLIVFLSFLDLSNLDNELHSTLCDFLNLNSSITCLDYYDLPIWEVFVTFGTILTAIIALKAINQSNKQMELEQTPYVVLKDGVVTAPSTQKPKGKLHSVSIKNVGKGSSYNIRLTADPKGQISIIEGSNPNSIDLGISESYTTWAIDEECVIKGFKEQNITISHSVMNELPNENDLEAKDLEKADFKFYIWYEDNMGRRYKTTTTVRYSGLFLKIMNNKFEKIV